MEGGEKVSEISGIINIEFPTNKEITEEQFNKFKHGLNKLIDDSIEMMIYDLAEECGFIADSYHPIIIDYLVYE